ncbi:Serine-threonine/tyrosine-protein kinase, catalytic domain [Dillenia turbinata]|uniref:Serine-threonine/tyrosine-protein kinase, catalytic domain n=1 Tax=Dillenia turbinata TaxID=194707 RepID=A0AAN8ZBN0_9MAGN
MASSKSWDDSESQCGAYNGYLASVTSLQDLNFVQELCNTTDRCYGRYSHREYLIILGVVSGLVLFSTLAVVIWLLAYRWSKRCKRSRKLSNPAASALVPPSWKIFSKEELRWLHHIPRRGRSLNWAMRMKVATTLAQGIAFLVRKVCLLRIAYVACRGLINFADLKAKCFLHDKVKPHVHRDIRASDVLLDEEFGAHLMGVGLSKFVPWDVMNKRTVMAGGTYGYLAPEFVYRNELTTKSDVYSFGVLLLEIISGRRPAQQIDSVGWQSIFEWATPLVQSRRYPELLDPLIITDIPEAGVIQKVVDLVYVCTQNVPSVLPRMSHVVHQLQRLAQPHIK